MTGESYVYPYALAYADGMRAGNAECLRLGGCAAVLDAFRDGYQNWQGYSMPFGCRLCLSDQHTTGGGQGPGSGGGGGR